MLLVRHTVRESGRHYWVPPGGGREPGETGEQCVTREVFEETGLTVRVVELLMVDIAEDERPGYPQHKTYLCEVVAGEAAPGYEPEDHGRYDISDVRWFALSAPDEWPAEVQSDPHTRTFLTAVHDRLL